ncbi:hypothetical protein [Nocardia sp. NPDC058497]|uniref:hypothetical protein n=1 Tax=Nocardia sp. NPDC058497 TaxID=3346529 RepID=UPI0036612CA4
MLASAVQEIVAASIAEFAPRARLWALSEDGQLIGVCDGRPELRYSLDPDPCGNGLISAAALDLHHG